MKNVEVGLRQAFGVAQVNADQVDAASAHRPKPTNAEARGVSLWTQLLQGVRQAEVPEHSHSHARTDAVLLCDLGRATCKFPPLPGGSAGLLVKVGQSAFNLLKNACVGSGPAQVVERPAPTIGIEGVERP